ncbi:MAG: HAD-IC family P-type ATPase [Syntrophomonadaceae bacterium]|nr:HAD-IC family P-type ATPase [Syntrophomonadaceae bacterium]
MFFSGRNKHYHHIPGRIRIFVPEICRNPTLSQALEKHLAGIPDLMAAKCNPATGRALIVYNEKKAARDQILYNIHTFQSNQKKSQPPVRMEKADEPEDLPLGWQGLRLAGLALAVLGLMVNRLLGRGAKSSPPWLFNLSAAAILVSSYPFFRSGWQKIPFLKRPGHDFWLGLTGCFFLILRRDLLGLLVLFCSYATAFVQARTLRLSEKELEKILNRLNLTGPANLNWANQTQSYFEKGQQINQGGTIVQGTAILDESSATGSPLPVLKYEGEKALSGSWVLAGKLLIEPEDWEEEPSESALPLAPVLPAEIYGVENFTRQITKVALAAALGVFLWNRSFERSLAVLLACNPSAASLSAAAVYRFGLARLSQAGVLIKDLNSLQLLKESDTVLFDKTGTLTGTLSQVKDVLPVQPEYTSGDIIRLSAACEQQVDRPAGQSILAQALAQGISLPPTRQQQIFVGQGVKGVVEGKQVRVGNQRFMEKEGIPLQPAEYKSRRLNHLGQSTVFVAVDNQVAGVIGLIDDIRPYSRQLIEDLHLQGVDHIGIITGDTDEAAQNLGRALGITQIWSQKLPEEKAGIVAELQDQGRIVSMVGDGINDVAAMRRADIGICMSRSKEKAVLEAVDIVLADGEFKGLTESIYVARLCEIIAQQNLIIASGTNYSSLVLAIGGVLNPLASTIIANLGTLGVLINSSRILRI